ncbi:MAG: TIGR00341 family protein [Erythrobacter sp.]|nr:TIGR00341 family protein [Erythrobacter sp.]
MASAPNDDSLTSTSWIDRALDGRLEKYRRWWRMSVVETVDQEEVIKQRRDEAYTSPRYLFMLAMSAGIAILGLLLSSPAVVIGAMLIAPLMGPIIGAGFALAIGDYKWLCGSALALAAGTILGVALTALIVFVSPLQTVTPEIAARTRPNLFDLAVAVFSALAGGYSMIRGREGTIVGVAIATALMPPLGVVGFGLATANWTVFSGALLLYVTNLMTIALVATLMARLYGFSARLSGKQTRWQTALIIAVFVALAVPLFFSLRQIVWESNAARLIRTTIVAEAGSEARISNIEFDLDAEPVTISATLLTPNARANAQELSEKALAEQLGRPVRLSLTQFRVGTGEEAEAIELLAAQASSRDAIIEEARLLEERLAVISGTGSDDITIDRDARRAIVRARIAGANLAAYRALETRIARESPGWSVRVEPPVLALPSIPFAEGAPTEAGRAALELVAWAALRRDQAVSLTGGSPEIRAVASELLAARGVQTTRIVGGPVMTAGWTATPAFETETSE